MKNWQKFNKVNEDVYDDFVKFDLLKDNYVNKLTKLQNETDDV